MGKKGKKGKRMDWGEYTSCLVCGEFDPNHCEEDCPDLCTLNFCTQNGLFHNRNNHMCPVSSNCSNLHEPEDCPERCRSDTCGREGLHRVGSHYCRLCSREQIIWRFDHETEVCPLGKEEEDEFDYMPPK